MPLRQRAPWRCLQVLGSKWANNTPTLRECLRRCHHCAIDMLYVHRRPASPLDAFVESVWICKNERRPRQLERILPWGGAQLIVNLADGHRNAGVVDQNGITWWIGAPIA
jgi:hypothetical protein